MTKRDFRDMYDYPTYYEIEQAGRDELIKLFDIDVDEKVIPLINDAMQELFRLVEQANEQGAGLDYGDEKRKILECYLPFKDNNEL